MNKDYFSIQGFIFTYESNKIYLNNQENYLAFIYLDGYAPSSQDELKSSC